ncbi:13841_t:CDS:2, partial [Ambispora leptoticha]
HNNEEHLRFRYIDGRRYHDVSNSEYMIPNDDEEADRLLQVHKAVKNIWGDLFYSPVKEKLRQGAEVVDVGCGPGAWVLDMAQKYPNSNFVGIDFSPIFPTEGLPVNVKFVRCNLLDGSPFEDAYFDFTHQKFMSVSYTEEQWKEKVIPELLRITKPGGWIETVEGDVIIHVNSNNNAVRRIAIGMENYFKSRGMNHQIGEFIPQLLENTNAFSEIRKEKKVVTLSKKGGNTAQELHLEKDTALLGSSWLPR